MFYAQSTSAGKKERKNEEKGKKERQKGRKKEERRKKERRKKKEKKNEHCNLQRTQIDITDTDSVYSDVKIQRKTLNVITQVNMH